MLLRPAGLVQRAAEGWWVPSPVSSRPRAPRVAYPTYKKPLKAEVVVVPPRAAVIVPRRVEAHRLAPLTPHVIEQEPVGLLSVAMYLPVWTEFARVEAVMKLVCLGG